MPTGSECLIRSRLAAPPLFLHPRGDEHAKRPNCYFCTRFNIQGQPAGQKAITALSKHKKIVPNIPVRNNQVEQCCRTDLPALESDDSEKRSPAAPVSAGNRRATAGSRGRVHVKRTVGERLWISRSQERKNIAERMACRSRTWLINE